MSSVSPSRAEILPNRLLTASNRTSGTGVAAAAEGAIDPPLAAAVGGVSTINAMRGRCDPAEDGDRSRYRVSRIRSTTKCGARHEEDYRRSQASAKRPAVCGGWDGEPVSARAQATI